MELHLNDLNGNELIVYWQQELPNIADLDAITCSPKENGFTVLNGIFGNTVSHEQLQAACDATNRKQEVCILPWRNKNTIVLLTPNVTIKSDSGEEKACNFMHDLFNASQHEKVSAESLGITQFGLRMNSYHITGILKAIKEIQEKSFINLKRLYFNVPDELYFKDCIQNVFPNVKM